MSAARRFSVRPSVMSSVNCFGTPLLSEVITAVQAVLAGDPVGVSVGGDHALVDAPGGFDLHVLSLANRACRR